MWFRTSVSKLLRQTWACLAPRASLTKRSLLTSQQSRSGDCTALRGFARVIGAECFADTILLLFQFDT